MVLKEPPLAIRGSNGKMVLQPVCLQVQLVNTPETRAQLDRELRIVRRAEQALSTQEARMVALHKESARGYGVAAFKLFHEALTDQLKLDLEEFAADPYKARQFASVFPFFDGFHSPEQIAAVALIAAIDQLSRRQKLVSYCQGIAGAMEAESRLLRLESKCPADIYQLLKIEGSKKLIEDRVLLKLGVVAAKWDRETKANIGLYLAQLIQHSTGLIVFKRGQVGKTQPWFIEPSEAALTLVRNIPKRPIKASHGPMTCPPRPWDHTLNGGGMLSNIKPLITLTIQDQDKSEGLDPFLKADLTRCSIPAVNFLQGVQLVMDADMVSWQRTAWEAGTPGLFPCSRIAPAWPERIGGGDSIEAWKLRKRLEGAVLEDREKHRNTRIKIERCLQMAEETAGQDVWQSWALDSRGRAYPANRAVTTQGPDHQKAMLGFKPQLAGAEGLEWLLMTAAGHSHLGKASWAERLQWGQANIERIRATADDPLNKTELWRSTDDPWQYLRACVGIRDTLDGKPTSSVVRFDQTTSGIGILAALVRDQEIGRACNLWGSTRQDLYTQVADAVVQRLRLDLTDTETPFAQENASFWLEKGISRKMMKQPVLAAPYGGTIGSLTDSIIDYLLKERYVPTDEYQLQVGFPARYLSRLAFREIKKFTASTIRVRHWLMTCCKLALNKQIPLEWTGPMGWPMRVADRQCRVRRITTLYYGKRVSAQFADSPMENKLNATAANRAIGANLVHSLDAALVHAVSYACGERKLDLLPNHDCFSCHPSRAKELHMLLLQQMRNLYAVDILKDMHTEMQARTGLRLPAPPVTGDLNPALIGENAYLFS